MSFAYGVMIALALAALIDAVVYCYKNRHSIKEAEPERDNSAH